MKNILVVSYSQSGQLDEIIDNFLIPFDKELIERVKIFPQVPFPFPWKSKEFFDAMPETVLEEKIELQEINFQSSNYEMIIIGYQPWYLSPSLPISSLLQNEKFIKLLKGTPVITIIGARNMWLNSQENIKEYIYKAGGELVANIPLIDRNNNQVSALTILHWMLTGKKQRFLNIFPYPGISQKDIKGADAFGKIVFKAFMDKSFLGIQQAILDLNLINIGTDILFIEARAKKIFNIFARIIKEKGTSKRKRSFLIYLFKYYLIIGLFILAPIILLIFNIFARPFKHKTIQKQKQYFYDIRRKQE